MRNCEEKNYIFYDETYLNQGYFIINRQNDKIVNYLKIFIMNYQGLPNYGLRAFSVNGKNQLDKRYSSIDFTFRSTEDEENGLYEVFKKLCLDLNGNKIETIDRFSQGCNCFSLKHNDKVVTLSIFKDNYGVKDATEFTDINIGDDMTCRNYDAIAKFYNQLEELDIDQATNEDIHQLLLLRQK